MYVGNSPAHTPSPDNENLQVYTSLLAAVATFARPGIAKLVNTHATWNLFGTWVVYVWRDVYPLGTFTLQPLDIEEGWLMWTKFGLLSVAAVFVPLFVPTEYIPLDPEVRHFEHHDVLFKMCLKVLTIGHAIRAKQGADCFVGILRILFLPGRFYLEGI